jgi:hypothetical protein
MVVGSLLLALGSDLPVIVVGCLLIGLGRQRDLGHAVS